MALFDFKDLLKEQMRDSSREGRLETKVVLGMFSEGADKVSKGGVQDFVQGATAANKAVTSGDLSPDDAALAIECLRRLMNAKTQYGEDFYKP